MGASTSEKETARKQTLKLSKTLRLRCNSKTHHPKQTNKQSVQQQEETLLYDCLREKGTQWVRAEPITDGLRLVGLG